MEGPKPRLLANKVSNANSTPMLHLGAWAQFNELQVTAFLFALHPQNIERICRPGVDGITAVRIRWKIWLPQWKVSLGTLIQSGIARPADREVNLITLRQSAMNPKPGDFGLNRPARRAHVRVFEAGDITQVSGARSQ